MAASHLDVSGDLVQRKHHVLEQAYERLSSEGKALLGLAACFRSPVEYAALRSLSHLPPQTFDASLQDLIVRGLLQHDRSINRYDLHPIVRRYAYDRLTGDERGSTHSRLRDYFAAVPSASTIKRQEDLAPVIELYHHSIRAGRFEEGWSLLKDRLDAAVSRQFTAVGLAIDLYSALFPDGEGSMPRLRSPEDQMMAIRVLSEHYGISDRPQRAIPLVEQYVRATAPLKDNPMLEGYVQARGLISLGVLVSLPLGRLKEAEALIRSGSVRAAALRETENIAFGHLSRAHLLLVTGQWKAAEAELIAAQERMQYEESIFNQRHLQMHRLLQTLLLARAGAPQQSSMALAATATNALNLLQSGDYIEFFQVRALWLIGAVERAQGDAAGAEQHLMEALTRCRRAGIIGHEADILLDLARLRHSAGDLGEALHLAGEAFRITERCGYTLQGADVNIFLARCALAADNRAKAEMHAQHAHRLASCDGPPEYVYMAAYREATALLQQLGLPS
jgi:tetratricopeptide (TPR) repeat protein